MIDENLPSNFTWNQLMAFQIANTLPRYVVHYKGLFSRNISSWGVNSSCFHNSHSWILRELKSLFKPFKVEKCFAYFLFFFRGIVRLLFFRQNALQLTHAIWATCPWCQMLIASRHFSPVTPTLLSRSKLISRNILSCKFLFLTVVCNVV